MYIPVRILILMLIAAVPAWYINRFLLKTIRPKTSFPHFLLYIVASLAIAFAYTFIAVFVLLKFIAPPNK